MAIRGSLREASLPDVLQLLAMGKKTGCLSVSHRQQFGTIHFDRGRISHAAIVNRRDRLGDILVKHGLVSPAALDAAIAAQAAEPQRRIGDLLVTAGHLRREQLHEYLKHQIEEAVYLLFTWSQGTFTFEPDVLPDQQDITVSISPESLLLEGARRVDEWSLIEKKIPSLDIVFSLDRDHLSDSNVEVTPEQEAVIPLIDGRRDVSAIVDDSGLDEFQVGKALFGLATAGFLRRLGRSRGPETTSRESRVAEHRNLGIAFYRTSMLDEAHREFKRVIDLRGGDVQAEFHLGLIALRQGRLEDAIRTFRGCAARPAGLSAALVNLAYALERAGRIDEARASLVDAAAARPSDPMVRLAQGVLSLRAGDVDAAARHLDECAVHWPPDARPAAWFHYASLVSALRGDLDRAVMLLEDGVRAYPRAAALHNNLAVVLERRGRYEEAAVAADRAITEDPAQAPSHKNAGDLHYRAGRYEDAMECYLRAVRSDPNLGGDVYLKLGNIRYRRRERDEAVRFWERSLALAPDNPMARNNLEMARRLA
jgi:tetratricopeptide (TPR) repeat protein